MNSPTTMTFKLLGTNAKLDKMNGAEYLAAGLSLAPARSSGIEVCPARTKGCAAACNLWFAGRTVTDVVRAAMKRRTLRLFADRAGFIADLHKDIEKLQRYAEDAGVMPLVRMNVASDLDWSEVINAHPDVMFYDYTKRRSAVLGDLPENYSLTYSWSERTRHNTAGAVLRRDRNIAMVFDTLYNPQQKKYGSLPPEMRIDGINRPVIDGDIHDFRIPEMDGRGVIVGLRLKGTNAAKQRARESGFAVKVTE